MDPAVLKELFRHMAWADGEVWSAVLAAPAANIDETVRKLFLHLHVVQRAFFDVWHDRPLTFPDVSEFPDAAQIQAWGAPYYADALAFLESLDEEALGRPVVLPWAEEFAKQLGITAASPSLAETIFQVTSHSTYHRGQINARLRALGGEPPLVDYIAWIWFGRPASGSPCGRSLPRHGDPETNGDGSATKNTKITKSETVRLGRRRRPCED